jgi:hypothetical protein
MCTKHLIVVAALILLPASAMAGETSATCPRQEVDTHVRDQFAQYGPLSIDHEYFGFVYFYKDAIRSSVTRSGKCHAGNCLIDTVEAAALIPRGAKVLGEWHTHPRDGSMMLSTEDVRGARNNANIRCYAAYYSKPDGEILSWDPRSTSVPTAMASRISIGNYESQLASRIGQRAGSEP